jgi:triacylglycerol lipase
LTIFDFRFALHTNRAIFMYRKALIIFVFFFHHCAFAQCDTAKRPIIFIHGFLASGDTWTTQVQRFIQAGYCGNQLFMFDWNTVGGNGKKTDSLLRVFVEDVLEKTNARQVDLIGHSAGGGLARGFLSDSLNTKNIAHYIHIGSRKWFTAYSWFPNAKCLNIYSAADYIAGKSGGDIAGAVNRDLKDKDHYEVATSKETFDAIYAFITNGAKPFLSDLRSNVSQVSGTAVGLGTNEPLVNARVEIYEVNSKTRQRAFICNRCSG